MAVKLERNQRGEQINTNLNSEKMNTETKVKGIKTDAKIFLTDYASYNNGKQFEYGHWVNLDDYSDAEELNDYITEHFKECDEKSPLTCGGIREEIMITDYEGFPEVLYSESGCDFEKIYSLFEFMEENRIESLENEDDNLLNLWNEYDSENARSENNIYNYDDDNLAMMFGSDPAKAFQAGISAKINYSDNYIYFNGYGHIVSTDDPSTQIDENALIKWILENKI